MTDISNHQCIGSKPVTSKPATKLTADQQIRARALECAAEVVKSNHLNQAFEWDVLEIAACYEDYIRDGRKG
jgi:hypothetical protein